MNNHIRRNQRFDCEQHNGIIYVKLGNLTDTALGRHWTDIGQTLGRHWADIGQTVLHLRQYLLVSHAR